MVGMIARMSGLFDFWFGHNSLIKRIERLEAERKEYDSRIENLTQATLDGDEQWFLQVVKKDPSCAMRVVEECQKKNAGRSSV
jgi:hypothetical protein